MATGPESRHRLSSSAAALLAAAALALAACGEDDSGDAAGATDQEVVGVGPVRANSTAQFASCTDWRRGTDDERYATIADIRGQLTPQTATDPDSGLPDESAYEIFDKVCANDFADSLRLYKLYARAQAYAPLRTDLEQ